MPKSRSPSHLLRNKDGASTVEYGVILAMIVLVVVIAIDGLASQTISMWEDVSTKSSNAMSQH
ncbi:Flp family type IVb pilin [Novosphingobium sp. CF614]|uniref:Flp family type IVb pilin n=1 Tax=Novosphingobium sp. CF614 TaxID=1884364 RepID=UPI000B85A125|nr:Flp family type IVb pilin [Novosphingobium sp. CF614]